MFWTFSITYCDRQLISTPALLFLLLYSFDCAAAATERTCSGIFARSLASFAARIVFRSKNGYKFWRQLFNRGKPLYEQHFVNLWSFGSMEARPTCKFSPLVVRLWREMLAGRGERRVGRIRRIKGAQGMGRAHSCWGARLGRGALVGVTGQVQDYYFIIAHKTFFTLS